MNERILKSMAAKAAMVTIACVASTGMCFAQGNVKGQATAAQSVSPQPTQNVNVANTPTVNVGNLPAVNVATLPLVNVGTLPAVNLAGTPTVNVATLPAVNVAGTPTVNVASLPPLTLGPGPVTNVGRLPSKQVMLTLGNPNCSTLVRENLSDGSSQCFDMANHSSEILVITDMEWEGVGALAGNFCTAQITPSQQPGNPFLVFGANADSNGNFATSLHLTTGLKLTVNPNVNGTAQCLISGNYLFTAQGYLIPNQ